MHFIIITITLVTCINFITLAVGSPAVYASTALDPLSNITTMKWTGLSKGVNVTLFGNAGDIVQQLKDLDPNWSPEYPDSNHTVISNATHITSRPGSEGANGLFCCPVPGEDFHVVSWLSIQYAAAPLYSFAGQCSASPYSCAVASCYNTAAILLCNNEPKILDFPCTEVAAYADTIVNGCPWDASQRTCGQKFANNTDGNVVVTTC